MVFGNLLDDAVRMDTPSSRFSRPLPSDLRKSDTYADSAVVILYIF